MKVKDLIKVLEKMPQEKELQVFAEGKIYPVLEIQNLDDDLLGNCVEIGCGWLSINEDEYDDTDE